MPLLPALIKLAHDVPAMRRHLVPIIRRQAAMDLIALKVKQFNRMLSMPGEFGILTAYGPGSKKQNKDRQTKLIKDLQKMGYDFDHLGGKWEGITEKSLLVPDIKASDLFTLGKKYDQISVIHKNKSGVVGMYYPKEGKVEVAIKPDASIAGEIAEGHDLWSKSRGNSFSFDFLWGQKQPWDGHKAIDKNQVKAWIAEGKLKPTNADGSEATPPSESKPDQDKKPKGNSDWFDAMGEKGQKSYCENHPGSANC